MNTQQRRHINLRRTRLLATLMGIAMGVVLLSGCAISTDEPSEMDRDQPTGDADVTLDIERFTMSQDTEMDHFAGAVDEALFIGVAVAEPNAGEEGPRTVAVYLCDSMDVSQWLFAEVAGPGAVLETGDARVDVTLAEDRVSGTVALGDEEPRPFTAELSTGYAGLYRAMYSQGGVDFHLDWVVLADGRSRGPLDGKGNDIPPPPPPSLQ